MIAAIFGFFGATKLPQWAMEAIFIVLLIVTVAGGIMWHDHEEILKGKQDQIAADNAASKKLLDQAQAETQAEKVNADNAEHAHDKELADLHAYVDAHPAQPVRLCLNTHGSGASLPHPASTNTGNESGSTPAAGLQQVPAGDSASGSGDPGPDIGTMLSALANVADQVSAELREYQAR